LDIKLSLVSSDIYLFSNLTPLIPSPSRRGGGGFEERLCLSIALLVLLVAQCNWHLLFSSPLSRERF